MAGDEIDLTEQRSMMNIIEVTQEKIYLDPSFDRLNTIFTDM